MFLQHNRFRRYADRTLKFSSGCRHSTLLFYFFFSTEHHRTEIRQQQKLEFGVAMIGFGAALGATVMGHISLVIGRFNFLFVIGYIYKVGRYNGHVDNTKEKHQVQRCGA